MSDRRLPSLTVESCEDRIAPAGHGRFHDRGPDVRAALVGSFRPDRESFENRFARFHADHSDDRPDRIVLLRTVRPPADPIGDHSATPPAGFNLDRLPFGRTLPAEPPAEPILPPLPVVALQVARGSAAVRRSAAASPGTATDLTESAESTRDPATVAAHESAPPPTAAGQVVAAAGTPTPTGHWFYVSATVTESAEPPASRPTTDDVPPETPAAPDQPAKSVGALTVPPRAADDWSAIGDVFGVPLAGAMTVDLAAVEAGATALLSQLSGLADDLAEPAGTPAAWWLMSAAILAAGAGYAATGGPKRRPARPSLVPDSFLARRGAGHAV